MSKNLLMSQVETIDVSEFVNGDEAYSEKTAEPSPAAEPEKPSESTSRKKKEQPAQPQPRTTIIVHKSVLDELNKIKFVQRLEATHVDSNSDILEKALACLVKSLPEKQRATYQRLFQNRE